MNTVNELNERLFKACTAAAIDYTLVENLLKLGAEPLGRIIDCFGVEDNLYTEVFDCLFQNTDTPEDIYTITELFVRYGMDISKPTVPYDDSNVVNPLWMFALGTDNTVLMRTLKLLLDNGLGAEDAAQCWDHALVDIVYIDGRLTNSFDYDCLYECIRKLMLIASYPHVLEDDADLRRVIWLDYNIYDVTRFRQWDAFTFDIDTSRCDREADAYRSVVTIREKSSGKAVWMFGFGLKPEDVMQ